jgi:sugar O-acyltransferase (sialic acid O-acetyltransferase NeuD family)
LNKYAIIGYGGHSHVIIESLFVSGLMVDYYFDFNECDFNPYSLKFMGSETQFKFEDANEDISFILGLGDNKKRDDIATLLQQMNQKIISVIDSSANVSSKVKLGIGLFISKGVLVNPFSSIGDFVILNSGCIIEHGCKIDRSSHIAPGAVICGDVNIGKRTFVGANSVINQGITIGDDVTIGSGTVVINDIKSNSVVVGNPGRIIR